MQVPPLLRLALALVLGGSALVPSLALAHAVIIASDPATDAVLRGPDQPVLLRFNSRIDQERSRLTLLRPDAETAPVTLDASTGPDTLGATLHGLAPGHYRLRWQVLAIDGHITRGDLPFEIAP
jgi:copper resistance protein C